MSDNPRFSSVVGMLYLGQSAIFVGRRMLYVVLQVTPNVCLMDFSNIEPCYSTTKPSLSKTDFFTMERCSVRLSKLLNWKSASY